MQAFRQKLQDTQAEQEERRQAAAKAQEGTPSTAVLREDHTRLVQKSQKLSKESEALFAKAKTLQAQAEKVHQDAAEKVAEAEKTDKEATAKHAQLIKAEEADRVARQT